MKANPSVGVALRIRSVTTKPTASDNANTLGTQLAQNGGQGSQVTVTTTQTNVAADTYFFSSRVRGPRTLTQREVQFDQASYSKVTTETGWLRAVARAKCCNARPITPAWSSPLRPRRARHWSPRVMT